MKKTRNYRGKKLLVLGLLVVYMCMAAACTRKDDGANGSGDMAGTGTDTELATPSATTPSTATPDNNDNVNDVTNGSDSLMDDVGNAVDDVVDGVTDGTADVIDGVTNGTTEVIDGVTNGTGSATNGTNR